MDRVDSKFMQPGATPGLPALLEKVGKPIGESDIARLLSLEDGESQKILFEAARQVRRRLFGEKIFMAGFVYFSTYCRNECVFCSFRRSHEMKRYRKNPEEILNISENLARFGVNLIDLTMGEDEEYYKDGLRLLISMVKDVKSKTGLPVMVSPGVVGHKAIKSLAEAGADWLALYQETHNRKLFAKLRMNQSYEERMEAKLYARSLGMLIEEGILTGVGETIEDLAHSILEMNKIGANQVRIMSFCPQPGTPMEKNAAADRSLELKVIAVMRLLMPGALIPASLDIDGLEGLADRVNAGANIITSIIPQSSGLSGVATTEEDVEKQGRTAGEASKVLELTGLEAASPEDYASYLEILKTNVRKYS